MIPIAQALQTGDIQAAYARYEEIKDSPDYLIDAGELIPLYYQLMSVKQYDLAIGLLELDLHAFPERPGLYIYLARTQWQKGDRAQAEAALQKALALHPHNTAASALLEKIR